MAVESTGNLAVLEPWGIARYGPKGDFLGRFGRKGQAPGEFNCPLHLASNQRNHLFVYEGNGRRVSVFDPGGRLFSTFKVPHGRVFDIAADSRDHVYVGAYDRGAVIHGYTAAGEHVLSFGEYPGEYGDYADLLEGGKLTVDCRDHIYLSEPQEYRIQVFDTTGRLVKAIRVESDFFLPPKFVPVDEGRVQYEAGVSIMGLAATPAGVLAHQYLRRKEGILVTDLFSSGGAFLARFEETAFAGSGPRGQLMAAASEHVLVFGRRRPFSCVRLYLLSLPPYTDPVPASS